MKTNLSVALGLVGVVGLSVLGCSSPSSSCGAACAQSSGAGQGPDEALPAGEGGDSQVGAGGGDDVAASAGDAGAGGSGGEVSGAGGAGGERENEPSQWIVYLADEGTPGKNELYAVRVADLGTTKRFKISPELGEQPWVPIAESAIWSPDGSAYAFQADYGGGSDFYIVRFRDDGVEPAQLVAPSLPPGNQYWLGWSPSGSSVMLVGKEGVVVAEPDAQGAYVGRTLAQFGYLGAVNAEWVDDETIIHSVIDEVSNEVSVFISTLEEGYWVTALRASSVPRLSWSLSADRTSIAYTIGLPNQPNQHTISIGPVGGTSQKVDGSGAHWLHWSPIGTRFVVYDQGKVSWGANALTTLPTPIPELKPAEMGFSPDGSLLEVWQTEESSSFVRLGLYDFAQGKITMHDVVRHVTASAPLAWAPDGSSVASVHQPNAMTDVGLVLVDTGSGRQALIDTAPPDHRFYYRYSDDGDFLFYDKGRDETWESAFVDLRGGLYNLPAPVKMPGEGVLWDYRLAPGGSNAVLVHHQDNGAKPCSYLDLSRQVAKPLVPVSGEGRVQYCVLQPRAK